MKKSHLSLVVDNTKGGALLQSKPIVLSSSDEIKKLFILMEIEMINLSGEIPKEAKNKEAFISLLELWAAESLLKRQKPEAFERYLEARKGQVLEKFSSLNEEDEEILSLLHEFICISDYQRQEYGLDGISIMELVSLWQGDIEKILSKKHQVLKN